YTNGEITTAPKGTVGIMVHRSLKFAINSIKGLKCYKIKRVVPIGKCIIPSAISPAITSHSIDDFYAKMIEADSYHLNSDVWVSKRTVLPKGTECYPSVM
ncbi:unnamed protein product, partial [marine sediment metagenome]